MSAPTPSPPSTARGDLTEVKRALGLLVEPGSVVELRCLRQDDAVVSGYFDDIEKLCAALTTSRDTFSGVYVTLNPVDPALLARAHNRLRDRLGKKGRTTADTEIVKRTRLLLDIDHERPSGISATDDEHRAALARALVIRDALTAEGWPVPLRGDSGNGSHLVYAIDLPAEDEGLVARLLKTLAARFNAGEVKLDVSVANPSRISKLYGTVARKGDSTQERPHRRAKILAAPEKLEIVSRELLEKAAGPAPEKPAAAQPPAAADWDAAAEKTRSAPTAPSGGDLARAWPRLGVDALRTLLGGDPWIVANQRLEGPCPSGKGRCAEDPRAAFIHPRTDGGPPGAICGHKGTCGARVSLYDLVLARSTGDRARATRAILAAAGLEAPATPASASKPATAPSSTRPTIVMGRRLLDLALEGERALISQKQELYSRSGEIVHVVRDSRGSTIKVLGPHYLKALLSQCADWIAKKRVGKTWNDVGILPPKDVVDTLAHKGSWAFPTLEGIVAAPVLRADGTVLDRKGYDPISRLIYEPAGEYPPVPVSPTRDDAREALRALSEPFSDFPFPADHHRSAVLALVLTILGRPAIPGPCPLFLVRATAAGTGKQLLVSAVGNIALGAEPVTFAAPKEDEEWSKKITTHVRSARAFVVIDEARHLDSPSLASAITQEFYSNRLLGLNEDVHGRVPVYASCGNQTTLAGDMGRRVVPIELDAGVERPEQRGGFRIADLPAWVARERPRLVVAALTALRAFVVAGRPDQGLRELGSFAGWSRLVRNTLVWAGLADPVAGQAAVREEADVGEDDSSSLIEAMRDAFSDQPRTLRQIVDEAFARASFNTDLRDALAAYDPKGEIKIARLGYVFRKLKRTVRNGFMLTTHEDPDTSKAKANVRMQQWKVVQAKARVIPLYPAAIPRDPASHEASRLGENLAGSRDTSPTLRTEEEEKRDDDAVGAAGGEVSRDPAGSSQVEQSGDIGIARDDDGIQRDHLQEFVTDPDDDPVPF